MPIPSECMELANEIEALTRERNDLQAELRSAPPGAKPRLAAEIKRINSEIATKRLSLNACIIENGGTVASSIAVTLSGTMSFVTDRNFKGEPYSSVTTWVLLFNGERTQVFSTPFSNILIDTTELADQVAGFWKFLFGPNITTISLTETGSGSFSKSNGALVIPAKFLFDHSRDAPIYIEDSYLSVNLSTENPGGSRLNSSGNIILTGTGAFSEGYLNGVLCTITFSGTLLPMP